MEAIHTKKEEAKRLKLLEQQAEARKMKAKEKVAKQAEKARKKAEEAAKDASA